MFPTFESITHQHPRLIALLGAALFFFGAYLWFQPPEATHTSNNTVSTETPTEEPADVSQTEEVLEMPDPNMPPLEYYELVPVDGSTDPEHSFEWKRIQ